MELLLGYAINKKRPVYKAMEELGIFMPKYKSKFVTLANLKKMINRVNPIFMKDRINSFYGKLPHNSKYLLFLLKNRLQELEIAEDFGYESMPDKPWIIDVLYSIFPDCYIFSSRLNPDFLAKCITLTNIVPVKQNPNDPKEQHGVLQVMLID